MRLSVAEIAAKLGAAFEGDGARPIEALASLRDAGPADLSFLANARYAPDMAQTHAGVVIVGKDWNKPTSAGALIRVGNPDQAFALVAEWFAPPAPRWPAGVHPTAVVASDVQLGRDVVIGPLCVIEPGVTIGDRCVLVAQCYVGHGARLGADTRLYPQVTLRERVVIGQRCIIHNGTVIGSDGFGYVVDAQGVRTKIPQTGIVAIGDDVEIGANVTIDRARFGQTRIGTGVKIDNLVQIAHNCIIGDHAVIIAQVGISGSSEVGHHAILAGQVGVAGHLTIGPGAIVGAQAGVSKDIPAKAFVLGAPAIPREEFGRMVAHMGHLGEYKQRLVAVEKQVAALAARGPAG